MSFSSKLEPDDDPLVQRRDCRKRAMDLLARREHGCQELARKLANKGFDGELAVEVVATLASEGLVADERFAEAFTRSRVNRGQGPRRIELELRERGIGDAVIATALAQADCDWVSVARGARIKRFGPQSPQDLRGRGQQTRFLSYRGFTGEQIKRAMEVADDTD